MDRGVGGEIGGGVAVVAVIDDDGGQAGELVRPQGDRLAGVVGSQGGGCR
jgi:hypothetical protein